MEEKVRENQEGKKYLMNKEEREEEGILKKKGSKSVSSRRIEN